MPTRRALLQGLALVASGLGGACGRAPIGPPPKPPLPPTRAVERRERLAARLAPFVERTPGAGVAFIRVDASGSDVQSFGRSGYHAPQAPRADSLFELGGTGEALLALVLSERVARGRVKLEQPIASLLPESLRFAGSDAVSLESLALHTSGLPALSGDPARQAPASEDAMAALLRGVKLEPAAPAPARVVRSALGTELLAFALARNEGHPYGNLLAERIIEPLGMTTTGTFELTGGLDDRSIEGFDARGTPVPPSFKLPLFGAPFAVRSSPTDVARLLSALLRPSAGLAAALSASVAPRLTLPDDSELSLGFRIERGRARYWQSGWTTAFASAFLLEPAASRAFAVLVASPMVDAVALARELLREVDLPSDPTRPADRTVVSGLPANATRAQADFGGTFRLLGWTLDSPSVRPGGEARVVLFWQCLARTPRDFQVSVMGEGASAKLRADHYPASGRFPTFDWRAGEIVADAFTVYVPRAWEGDRVALRIGWSSGMQALEPAPGPVLQVVR